MKFSFYKTVFVACLLLIAWQCMSQESQQRSNTSYQKFKDRSSSGEMREQFSDALELRKKDPAAALEKVKEALAMSIADNNTLYEGRCYVLIGHINTDIAEWKLALDNFSLAYEKLKPEHSRTREYWEAVKGMGDANLNLANYEEALRLYNEARRLRPAGSGKIVSSELPDAVHFSISEVYFQMGRYDDALKELESIQLHSKDATLEAKVENQKGKIYAAQNQVEKASQSIQSSQEILLSNIDDIPQNEQEKLQSAKEDLSASLITQNRVDEEIALRSNSIKNNISADNLGEVSKDKVKLGKALASKGEATAAIRELEEAAFIADTIGDPRKQAQAFLALAELHEQYGHNQQALNAYKKFSTAVSKVDRQNEEKLIERSELIKKQREIEELARFVTEGEQEETLAKAMVTRQRLIIYGLIVLIVVVGVTSWFTYKNSQASKRANQLLALKSLRSQMNPHFIFNALNSLNHFVAQNDERTANKFLSEFSRLMRLVLENSQLDFIPLHKEEEIISLYLKLEHYRFREKFDYEIYIDDDINKEAVEIPPMLIQPYIENAVWHGLRYKDEKGFLSVQIKRNDDDLVVEITDNGIGRRKSAELKTENQKKHQSTGIRNIRERLLIINRIYHAGYEVVIDDLPGDSGTRVRILVPVNKKTHAAA